MPTPNRKTKTRKLTGDEIDFVAGVMEAYPVGVSPEAWGSAPTFQPVEDEDGIDHTPDLTEVSFADCLEYG